MKFDKAWGIKEHLNKHDRNYRSFLVKIKTKFELESKILLQARLSSPSALSVSRRLKDAAASVSGQLQKQAVFRAADKSQKEYLKTDRQFVSSTKK